LDFFSDGNTWSWVAGLGTAAALGGLIGGEREHRGHPAGVRTQALVALASALLTATGKAGFPGADVDLSRIASQVVTGVGFIGAGVILKHRGTVIGLTTAATLFLSAGLGVAVGAGLVVPAAIATAIALILTYGLRVLKPLLRSNDTRTVRIDYVQGHGTFGPLLRAIQDTGCHLSELNVEDELSPRGEPLRHVTLQVLVKKGSGVEKELEGLARRSEVLDLTITDG
jgi:putative Mg2+ transporter-C (MgtC) family protein